MDALIASSTSLFEATTGFSFSALVTWAVSILKMILGMALGLINAIMPVILAIVVISVIVGLIYKGLQWLHVIR